MNGPLFVFLCDGPPGPPHPMRVGFEREEYDECDCGKPLRAVEVVPRSIATELAEALEAITHYASPPHDKMGEACGIDLCIGCLIEGTAQKAVARFDSLEKGEQE